MKALLHRAVPRRILLTDGGRVLSVAGLTALVGAGVAGRSIAQPAPGQDVQLLNTAIALEHEGIAAYTIAAGSGLLKPEMVKIGAAFRGHHERHRDELVKAVQALGGKPIEAKPDKEYAMQLDVAKLKSEADVLRLALGLERGAANAYLGLIPSLGTSYHQIAGRMAGDEAFHVAILGQALGEPIPTQGLMFGG
ncbi:MAG: ferritin-like domain-containing protein [Alphaproteobacteria bacterium]|nr:ferritin-like domain-containing protein [Alphaproteobacteria bacterium]MCW5741655.1 ferritin-like domain-containing protein [Alphaproteobacteria bacterium]